MTESAQNNVKKTRGKPFQKGNPHAIKPGEVRNPGGRPKNEVSITHWLKEFGGMTSEEVANACQQYAKEFKALKTGDIPLAGVLALRWWMAMVNEPSPGMLGHALERIDGPVKQTTVVETWQDQLITLLKDGKLKPDDVINELGADLATPIIVAAGLWRNGSGEAGPQDSQAD